MATIKIMSDVETRDLKIGDIAIHGDGAAYFLQGTYFEDGEEYGELYWREQQTSGATFTSTAQPWNTWPTVIRQEA